jgi:hypothetical protein
MNKILFIISISISILQGVDPATISNHELRTVLENTSRSAQKVFVEDFTGLQ